MAEASDEVQRDDLSIFSAQTLEGVVQLIASLVGNDDQSGFESVDERIGLDASAFTEPATFTLS